MRQQPYESRLLGAPAARTRRVELLRVLLGLRQIRRLALLSTRLGNILNQPIYSTLVVITSTFLIFCQAHFNF